MIQSAPNSSNNETPIVEKEPTSLSVEEISNKIGNQEVVNALEILIFKLEDKRTRILNNPEEFKLKKDMAHSIAQVMPAMYSIKDSAWRYDQTRPESKINFENLKTESPEGHELIVKVLQIIVKDFRIGIF